MRRAEDTGCSRDCQGETGSHGVTGTAHTLQLCYARTRRSRLRVHQRTDGRWCGAAHAVVLATRKARGMLAFSQQIGRSSRAIRSLITYWPEYTRQGACSLAQWWKEASPVLVVDSRRAWDRPAPPN